MWTRRTPLPLPRGGWISRIATWWQKAHPYCERWHPLAIGIVAFFVVHRMAMSRAAFDAVMLSTAPAAISVAAIFAGFQGVVHAILLSMLRSRAVRELKKRRSYERLIGYVKAGIISLTLFVAMALLSLFANSLNLLGDAWLKFIASGLIGLFTFSLLASMRIMMLEVSMLQVPDDDAKSTTV